MIILKIFIFFFLSLTQNVISNSDISVPFDVVLNLDHLKELLFSRDSPERTTVSSVLVMSNAECQPRVDAVRSELSRLVTPVEYAALFHDETLTIENTWYKLNSNERLSRYFPMTRCPTVYFIPSGYELSSETTKKEKENNIVEKAELKHNIPLSLEWNYESDIKEWVWSNMMLNLTLVNDRDEGVIFLFYGPKVSRKAVFIAPKSEETVSAFIGNIVTVVNAAGEFFYGWKIHSSSDILVIANFHQAYVSETETDWIKDAMVWYQSRGTLIQERRMCDMRRHLLNMKQPPLVKNFTEVGYKKSICPRGLHTLIYEYYKEHSEDRHIEAWVKQDTNINQYDVRNMMVTLPQMIEEAIYRSLQPLLEDWCKCQLERQALYGIREYYKGHVLRNHVDRLNTHAISAIIQVHKELDGAKDWLLEVVDYNGERNEIVMDPGDMVLYESARLIHGRPNMFEGRIYANIFVHFRPLTAWPYSNIDNELTDGNKTINIWPLNNKI